MRTAVPGDATTAFSNKFEFDFRQYTPYKGADLKKSGLYVFKTADNDSKPLNHSIADI